MNPLPRFNLRGPNNLAYLLGRSTARLVTCLRTQIHNLYGPMLLGFRNCWSLVRIRPCLSHDSQVAQSGRAADNIQSEPCPYSDNNFVRAEARWLSPVTRMVAGSSPALLTERFAGSSVG